MRTDHGGGIIGSILERHGVKFLFTLCGGHISPILVGAKACGIEVIDCRDEANAVFAADAMARLTGIPGIAAVTAGPGVTNTITALKNAEMAQSPVILFGGATATILKGRGALQDTDQMSLVRPIVKWATTITQISAIGPTLDEAFERATSGVPGPVFIEVPVDLLYPEAMVRGNFIKEAGVEHPKTLGARALRLYLDAHLQRQFHWPTTPRMTDLVHPPKMDLPRVGEIVRRVARRDGEHRAAIAEITAMLRNAQRPVLVIGSQTMSGLGEASGLAQAVRDLGIPTYLGGMARGLLGREDPLQFRHARGKALKEADLVIVAGFPFDFRLGYGRGFGKAKVVAANLSVDELLKNRTPEVAVQLHPARFLEALARSASSESSTQGRLEPWFDVLRAREATRDAEIQAQAAVAGELVNPMQFFLKMDALMDDDATLVADGGDFVATASYILRPRGPLRWLDPGVFGTLGVGGGFALAAAALRRGRETWILYGDGSSAYTLAEFDSFARHGLAPIAVIGNDACWAQIAREQVEMLGDDVGTVLARTAYHDVAKGYGGVGLLLDDPSKIDDTLQEAKTIARSGRPVCINVHIARTDFRKGSISI